MSVVVKGNDYIQFEERYEIDEIINALETYMQDHQNASELRTVNKLCNLLSAMYMEW